MGGGLGNDLHDRRGTLDADQLLVQPVVEVRQAIRIEPELVQNGGVKLLDLKSIFYGGMPSSSVFP